MATSTSTSTTAAAAAAAVRGSGQLPGEDGTVTSAANGHLLEPTADRRPRRPSKQTLRKTAIGGEP